MPAVPVAHRATFPPGALGILADGTAHFSVGGDPLPEAATADNLLFFGGASSSEYVTPPFSSRTVRSSTTLKFSRINVGFVSDNLEMMVIPITCPAFSLSGSPAPDFFHRAAG